MKMKIKIRRIGSSLGILIPKDVLSLMHLNEGDELEFEGKTKQIDITLRKK